MTFARVLFSLIFSCVPLLAPKADPEIDELPRSTSNFSYYQLGRHVPKRSGWPNYIGGRTVIHDNLNLPLEIDPKNHRDNDNKQHMYCNTQVWGFGSDGEPTGKSNHVRNYSFPWTSTFCERRDFSGTHNQQTRDCGFSSTGQLRKSHQGSDCRPPAPEADKFWMVAVEDGTVVRARRNLVEMIGVSGIKWKYRHGGQPRSEITPSGGGGVQVTKGERLARVTNLGSTSIHLHLESERPAGSDRDNLPSLILAYQRALGVTQTPVDNGELKFDERFEISEGTVASPCAESENVATLGTSASMAFASYWCHNGSIMGLVKQENSVRFVYHKPRPGIRSAAIREPILFRGNDASGNWSGDATWYSRRCGDRPFSVNGSTGNPGGVAHVTLQGRRPSFSGGCDEPQFLNETLTFSFLRQGVLTDGDGALVPEFGVRISGPCAAIASARPVDGFEEFRFSSLWCHNDSLMGITENSRDRELVYFKPKDSLRNSVGRNRILFKGHLQDGVYAGKALQYNRTCGDPKFDVTGQEVRRNGKRVIELSGTRPVLRPNCSVIRRKTEDLDFTFISDLTDSGGNAPLPETACRETAQEDPINPEEEISVSSLWCYDNSIVGMAENGSERKVVYYKPKPAVREAVKVKPLLFNGRIEDGTYRGRLHWQDTICDSNETDFSGFQVTENGVPSIVLSGKRHEPGQSCSDGEPANMVARFAFRETRQVTIGGRDPVEPTPVCRTDEETRRLRQVLSKENILRFSSRTRADLAAALVCHAGFLVDAKITTGRRLAHFMAQVATETGGIKRLDENMNYTAGRLLEVFPTRVTPQQARDLAHKPRQIANHVYGNRLGNRGRHTDDGWTYRGSGFLQLTGRENFRERGREVGLPLEENPQLARQPAEGLLAAVAYWSARSINTQADADNLTKVRKLVNGGTNGLPEARIWLRKAKDVFGEGSAFAESGNEDETRDALSDLLVQRGFLPAAAGEAPRTQQEISDALLVYQRSRNLPETGVLDDDTFYSLVDPREWRTDRSP